MRKIMAIAAAVLVAATAATAATNDVQFRVMITIPAAQVNEWKAMMDGDPQTFPVVEGETDRQKAARVSSEVLARWWKRQLQAYRNRNVTPVATNAVTGEVL